MSDRGAAKEIKITKKIFTDIAKRRTVTGSVTAPGAVIAIFTGRFTARSIIVSNPTSSTQTFQIMDGTTTLISFSVSANANWQISDCDLPFFSSVSFNCSSSSVIFTSGGFVP